MPVLTQDPEIQMKVHIMCYLCVTFILGSVMSSVFFPSMVHHTSVRESFRNVKKTSQGRIRSSPAKKGPSSPRKKGIAEQEQHQAYCCAVQNLTSLSSASLQEGMRPTSTF